MRCKQCEKEILGLGKPVLAPVILAFLLLGGGVFAQTLGRLTLGYKYVDGWVVALASLGVAAVLIWLGLVRRKCPGCGATKMFDAEAEEAVLTYERLSARKTGSAEQLAKIESELRVEIAQRVRSEIEAELRVEIAQRVRPVIEAELRIEIAQRVMSDMEAEVRSEIAAAAGQTRAGLEKELRPQLEQKLRSEIENQLRASMEKELRAEIENQRETRDLELRKKLEEELGPEIERKLRSTVEAELLPSLERALPLEYQNQFRPEIERARGKPAMESAAKPSVDGGKPATQHGTAATEPKAPSPQLTPPLAFIRPPVAHPIHGPAASAAPLAASKGATPAETGAPPSAIETNLLWRSPASQIPSVRPLSRPAAKALLATTAQAGAKAATRPTAATAATAMATEAGAPATQPAAAKAALRTPEPGLAEVALGVHERAQRRARVIVSDLALYDKDTLIKAAHAADSRMELGSLWKEAVRSYNQAVPSAVGSHTNYLGEELDRCLAKLRQA